MEYTFVSIEEQITRAVIETLLNAFPNANLLVEDDVEDDFGEPIIAQTRDRDELFEACRSVGIVRIYANNDWVLLVNGNDMDIISDYTVSLEPVLADLNAAIDKHFG